VANDSARDVHGIRVGRAKTHPTASRHQRGNTEGNRGHARVPQSAKRSTGIRSNAHDVIDPAMPKISPA